MPRWRELKRFCDNDDWELYKDTDYYYYRKIMMDGTIKKLKFLKAAAKYMVKCGVKF